MTVEQIMTQEVFKVSMDDTIGTIRGILKSAGFHHLLVVDGRQYLVGILSDRDILRVISPFLGTLSENTRDTSVLNRKVHQIMTRNPVKVQKNTNIKQAANILLSKNISCLPVVSSYGEIKGIITWKDILRRYN